MERNFGHLILLSFLGILVGTVQLLAAQADEPFQHLKQLSLSDLETRLAEIDRQLESLAKYNLRGKIGAIGYRSKDHDDSHHTEWFQVDLGSEVPIDQIVLVPALWRDTKRGFQADGFPVEFRILVGTAEDADGKVIASYGIQDRLLPRTAPVCVPCPGTTASWVRIEATELSPRRFDGKYLLELSEIFVFNGQENVAIQRPVETSSFGAIPGGPREVRFLVDGFVPYLMDAYEGQQSLAFVGWAEPDHQATFTIDLEQIHSIDRIHLHRTELSDTAPSGLPADYGIPRRLVVEGATQPDFADAVPLIENRVESVYDVGPIIVRRFPETACRYVRLIGVEPYIYQHKNNMVSHTGFAEIEVFSESQNVALGKPVLSDLSHNVMRSLSALTDGRNLYGKILPIRDWLNELSQRHDLETERPAIVATLNMRYARQKMLLNLMIGLIALLAIGIGFTVLIGNVIRMRQIAELRKRFAADLHDELGANLHTIGMLSDLAEEARETPEELSAFLRRIRLVTNRTGDVVRHWSDPDHADDLYTDFVADMQLAADRIVVNLDHDIKVDGQQHVQQLAPRTHADLLLFYQECLVNICRHAGATHLRTRLTGDDRQIQLTVTDNGRGMSELSENGIPPSLQRRVQLLGGKVSVESPATGGTEICLQFRKRKWGRRK